MRLPIRAESIFRSVFFAALGILPACASGPDYSAMTAGDYAVEYVEDIVLNDAVQGRDVRLQVSWPKIAADDSQRFPVIVFSHGAFCYPQQYRNITDYWVSQGYVVILPNHLDSPNLGKMAPADIANLLPSRVRDMSFVLDSLDEIETLQPELAQVMDHSSSAVAGHSFGGMIAMIKSGLHMQNSDGEPVADYADPRFSAAVVMSGVGQMGPTPGLPQVPYMAPDAFQGLTGPLLASGGTLDEGNVGTGEVFPWQWRMSAYTQSPPGNKYSLVLEDADHYLGGLICRDNRGGPDDPDAVAVVRGVQTAFLDAYVKDVSSARDWLEQADMGAAGANRVEFNSK